MLPNVQFYIYLVNDCYQRGISVADINFLKQNLTHFTFITYPVNQGKGHTLRKGVKQTNPDLCIYTDIDFAYTENSIVAIYQVLAAGKTDLAIGVRNEEYYKNVPSGRIKISKALRFLAKKLLHLPVNDTQAGLKGFNRKGREIFLRSNIKRYLFDLEFISMAASVGLKVSPVAVTLKPGIVFSNMNAKILLAESYNFLKFFLTRSS